MKFTTRSRYGTRMLLDVALHEEGGPVSLRDIAKRQHISMKYLEKLSSILRRAGYIESIAGSRGGYRLHRDASSILMGDVVFLLENGEQSVLTLDVPDNCERVDTCTTRSIWARALHAMRDTLNAVSLEDMLRDACFCPETPAPPQQQITGPSGGKLPCLL